MSNGETSHNAELNDEKLKAEINHLTEEGKLFKSQRIKGIYLTFSLVVTILATGISAVGTLYSIHQKNEELRLEARMQSTTMLIEKVIPLLSSGNIGRDQDDVAIQGPLRAATYMAAVKMCSEFPNLRDPIRDLLIRRDKNGDEIAAEILKECQLELGLSNYGGTK